MSSFLTKTDAFHGLTITTVTMLCARKSEHNELPANRKSESDFCELAKATAITLRGSRKQPQPQPRCISQTSDEACELAKASETNLWAHKCDRKEVHGS